MNAERLAMQCATAAGASQDRSDDQTSVAVSLTSTVAQWQELKDAWRELAAGQATVSPFTSWEWARTWWNTYADDRVQLSILVCRRLNQVIGIAPLVVMAEARWPLRPRRLRVARLLATGEAEQDSVVTEYGDFLAAPGHEQQVAEACAQWLCGAGKNRWDVLALENVLDGSNVHRWLMPALLKQGRPERRMLAALRYHAPLPSTWEAYVQQVKGRQRTKLRSYYKLLQKGGEIEVESLSTPERMNEGLERLAVLHRRRWNEKSGHEGAFGSAKFIAFHQEFASASASGNKASITFVRHGGSDVAGVYTLHAANTAFFYQTGFDPTQTATGSPGTLVLAADIASAIHSGRTVYDFMGSAPGSYKQHYGCQTTQMLHLYSFNRTALGFLSFTLWALREKLQTLRRRKPGSAAQDSDDA